MGFLLAQIRVSWALVKRRPLKLGMGLVLREGVVKEIVVKPNQIVKAGEVLAELDDTSLRNRLELASKALDIARADLQRATFKSFSDDTCWRGMTRMCVGACGLMSRKATQCAFSATTDAGISFLTMRQNKQSVATFNSCV